jgi:hypothetical protein
LKKSILPLAPPVLQHFRSNREAEAEQGISASASCHTHTEMHQFTIVGRESSGRGRATYLGIGIIPHKRYRDASISVQAEAEGETRRRHYATHAVPRCISFRSGRGRVTDLGVGIMPLTPYRDASISDCGLSKLLTFITTLAFTEL